MSEDTKEIKRQDETEEINQQESNELSETWAQDALGDLEDWIEEQGIYIRQ